MNVFKKIVGISIILFIITRVVFGAVVTLQPSTVPIGSYLNGSDGDQYFVQSLKIEIDDNGTGSWVSGDAITITLPANMTIADVDDDGSYVDEVSASSNCTNAVTNTVTAPDNQTIVLTTGGAGVVSNTDEFTVFFPILVPNTVIDGATENYTLTSTADEEASWGTTTVTYEADQLAFITFAADYNGGGKQSSEKGDVYPATVQAVTTALPNIIDDVGGLANAEFDNGANDWDGITLDNDDAGATLGAAETQYYVWACQDSTLKKIDEESGGHRPIVYLAGGQPTRANGIVATGGAGAPCDSDVEGGTFADVQLNGVLLTEGTWFFYVTSSITCDWVLARSDSVAIRHHPVFNAYNSAFGAGACLDYDADGLFDQDDGSGTNDDNVTSMYLESGGGVSRDGTWSTTTNTDNVKIHWEVDDVDDNANVKIYLSTTDGIIDKATLISIATQISPDTLWEEGVGSQYWTYDIWSDATTYETAGDFYVYLLADDGKNSNVYQMKNQAGTNLQLKIKHYPQMAFQDLDKIGVLYEATDGGNVNSVDINTNDYQYININWGETIDGDKDADGDLTIKLYMSDLTPGSGGTAGYNDNVASVDTTLLPADAINDPTHTVHIATIIDNADDRTDNQYMFDVRNSGLAAGTYYIYGIISQNGDAQVVKYEGNGDAVLPSGDYDVYLTYTDDADFTDAADDYCVKTDGILHITSFADQNTSFELSPNRVTAIKGDTLTFDIYATDGGGANDKAMFVSVFLNIPSAKFSVLDQDASVAGIQPWLDETANFNGTEYLDTVYTNGSNYYIDHVEYASGGDALATLLKIGTIQLVVIDNYDNDALETHEITFSTLGARTTSIVEEDNNTLSTTVPALAATIELATPGKITGNIEIYGRTAEGQVVDIYVCPQGSFTQVTDSDFLTANGLASATDILQYTLGAGGSYEILRVPTGTYDIIIHKDGFLNQRIESQIVQSLSITNVDFEGDDMLLSGDCAGYTDANGNVIPDNQIDAADYNAISSAFNSTPGDANWNAYCDFDGDGHVFISDLNAASRNAGSGEGVLYKKVDYKGNNNNADIKLIKDDAGNYIVKGENLANVRAYAAKLIFNTDEYEITEFIDGLDRHNETYKFYAVDENSVYFVSAIYGNYSVESYDLDLCKICLTPKVNNPTEPILSDITIIDANNSSVNALGGSNILNNVPLKYALEKNYPNPFNPTTTIQYALPEAGNVRLIVYDLLGNKVRSLVATNLSAGRYESIWNACNDRGVKVSSGIYYYSLIIDNKKVNTKKMVLIK